MSDSDGDLIDEVDDQEAVREQRIAELARELKQFDPDLTYYSMKTEATDEGIVVSFTSSFAGWPEDMTPEEGNLSVELRAARPFDDPAAHAATLDGAGYRWLAVTTQEHLAVYMRIGGRAIIAEPLARKFFAHHLEPREVVASGPMGFVTYDPEAREVTARAPTRKQRLRIMKRDGYRCRLCGARPTDDVNVKLHLHHVRPFGIGGLTEDENLITICETCHNGLDPHHDIQLFFVGGHLSRALEEEEPGNVEDRVLRYREWAAETLEALKDD